MRERKPTLTHCHLCVMFLSRAVAEMPSVKATASKLEKWMRVKQTPYATVCCLYTELGGLIELVVGIAHALHATARRCFQKWAAQL